MSTPTTIKVNNAQPANGAAAPAQPVIPPACLKAVEKIKGLMDLRVSSSLREVRKSTWNYEEITCLQDTQTINREIHDMAREASKEGTADQIIGMMKIQLQALNQIYGNRHPNENQFWHTQKGGVTISYQKPYIQKEMEVEQRTQVLPIVLKKMGQDYAATAATDPAGAGSKLASQLSSLKKLNLLSEEKKAEFLYGIADSSGKIVVPGVISDLGKFNEAIVKQLKAQGGDSAQVQTLIQQALAPFEILQTPETQAALRHQAFPETAAAAAPAPTGSMLTTALRAASGLALTVAAGRAVQYLSRHPGVVGTAMNFVNESVVQPAVSFVTSVGSSVAARVSRQAVPAAAAAVVAEAAPAVAVSQAVPAVAGGSQAAQTVGAGASAFLSKAAGFISAVGEGVVSVVTHPVVRQYAPITLIVAGLALVAIHQYQSQKAEGAVPVMAKATGPTAEQTALEQQLLNKLSEVGEAFSQAEKSSQLLKDKESQRQNLKANKAHEQVDLGVEMIGKVNDANGDSNALGTVSAETGKAVTEELTALAQAISVAKEELKAAKDKAAQDKAKLKRVFDELNGFKQANFGKMDPLQQAMIEKREESILEKTKEILAKGATAVTA